MITNGLKTSNGNYAPGTQKTERGKAALKAGRADASKSAEAGLSDKAKKFLESLREINEDFDFVIADDGEDAASGKGGRKEFSVILSTEEIEKMANDDSYAMGKIDTIRNIVGMSDRINAQFGFAPAFGGDGSIEDETVLSRFSVAIGDDGEMTLFADLEKLTSSKNENGQDLPIYKRTRISAGNEEDLMDRISLLDWDKVPVDKETAGLRFDQTV